MTSTLEVQHFNGGKGCFFSLVSKLSTRAIKRLLLIQGGEHPKNYGLSGF